MACSAPEIEITKSTSPKFGHYQCNSAMKMAKALCLPPRKIAESLMASLPQNDLIASLEIAGPGLINITLK
jgi:arginyl-tRNA synthetase